jgi:hypothetical protein
LCSITIIVWNLYFYFKLGSAEKESWTKIFYTIVGTGWLFRYLLYFIGVAPFGKENINAFVLGLVTLTLASLTVGSIVRVQRETGKNEFRNDIIKFITRR